MYSKLNRETILFCFNGEKIDDKIDNNENSRIKKRTSNYYRRRHIGTPHFSLSFSVTRGVI